MQNLCDDWYLTHPEYNTECEWVTPPPVSVAGCGDCSSANCDGDDTSELQTLSINLTAGWNWISFNVMPEDADTSVNTILDSLGDNAEFILSQTSGTSTNYPGYGLWSGLLETLEPGIGYQLEMAAPDTLTITGTPVDVASTPIELSAGWNWLGYLPQNPQDISIALESISDSADFISSQADGSSTYYDDYGWAGSLEMLEPGKAYMLQMNAPDELIYPDTSSGRNGREAPPRRAGRTIT